MELRFGTEDYIKLHNFMFRDEWPGYKPNVQESPDGNDIWDTGKRYAHANPAYINEYVGQGDKIFSYKDREAFYERQYKLAECDFINKLLWECHDLSVEYAAKAGIPSMYWPCKDLGTLRIVEYEPDHGSAMHTDFNLITINLWRSETCLLRYEHSEGTNSIINPFSSGVRGHFGELAEMLCNIKALKHYVEGVPRAQFAALYFALPGPNVILPDGRTVQQYIDERTARSRRAIKE